MSRSAPARPRSTTKIYRMKFDVPSVSLYQLRDVSPLHSPFNGKVRWKCKIAAKKQPRIREHITKKRQTQQRSNYGSLSDQLVSAHGSEKEREREIDLFLRRRGRPHLYAQVANSTRGEVRGGAVAGRSNSS